MRLPLTDPRDEPTERQGLEDFLEYYRQVMRRKVHGLTNAELNRTVSVSSLTLGGIIKHLSLVEDSWFVEDLLGRELPTPWSSVDWKAEPDWEFESASEDTPEYLLELHDEACDRSRRILSGVDDLDQKTVRAHRDGEHFNVRWILIHMIEEYARHVGHADLIRESIDGSIGD